MPVMTSNTMPLLEAGGRSCPGWLSHLQHHQDSRRGRGRDPPLGMAIESALRSSLQGSHTQKVANTLVRPIGADAAGSTSRLDPSAPVFVSSTERATSSRYQTTRPSILIPGTSRLDDRGPETLTSPHQPTFNLGNDKSYSDSPRGEIPTGLTTHKRKPKVNLPPSIKSEQEHWTYNYQSEPLSPARQQSEQYQQDHSINAKRQARSSDASEEKAHIERRVSRQEDGPRKEFDPASRHHPTGPCESTSGKASTGDPLEVTDLNTGATVRLPVSDDSRVSEPRPHGSLDNLDAVATAPNLENPHNRQSQLTDRIDANSTASSSDLSSALSLDDPSHNIPATEDQTSPESDSAVADSDASSSTTDSGPYVSPGPSFNSPSTSNYTEHSNDNGDDDPDTSSNSSSHKAPARTASARSRHSLKSTRDRTNLPIGSEGRVRRRITASHNANLEHLGQNRPASHKQTAAETMYILMDAGTKLGHALVDVQQYLSTADGAIPSHEDHLLNDIKSSVATLRIRTQDVEEAAQRLEESLNHVARPRESGVPSLRPEGSDTDTEESDVRPNPKRIEKARKRPRQTLRKLEAISQQQVPVEKRQAPTSGSPARVTRNSAETSIPIALDFTRPSRKPKGFAERADSVLDYV